MKDVPETYRLDWIGPLFWTRQDGDCVFDSPAAEEQGIYIWTVQQEGAFLPYYVGETGRTFAVRFQEHTKEYISGVYRIYDPKQFVRGIKRLVWDGLWKKDRLNLWPYLLDRYVELAPVIYSFLSCFRLFLAPLDVDRRTRERIEAAVGDGVKNHDDITQAFFDDAVRYRPRREAEEPFKFANCFYKRILGLEDVMFA